MKGLIGALAAVIALAAPCAMAQPYPARALAFVVPFAERMGRGAKQAFVVENVAGAGGTLGATRVARAKADGYTFLIGHVGYMAAAPGLYKQLAYDPVQDFEAVARFPDTPLVLIAGRDARARTIQGLIDFARRNPDKLNVGNAGVGSSGHLVAALFASGIKAGVTHVSYKGNAPALTDIISGRIDCMFDQSNTALPQVRGEKVIALATTSKERLPQMPTVPTLSESGLPGFDVATWYGIYAPKGTPRESISWVHAQFAEAMQDQAFTSRLVEQGYVLLQTGLDTPDALAAHTRKEVELWKKVIADAGIPGI